MSLVTSHSFISDLLGSSSFLDVTLGDRSLGDHMDGFCLSLMPFCPCCLPHEVLLSPDFWCEWDFPPVLPGFHRCCRGVCCSSACLSFIRICLFSPASGKSCFCIYSSAVSQGLSRCGFVFLLLCVLLDQWMPVCISPRKVQLSPLT